MSLALGELNPVIRIQVDQQLALESGMVGELRDDASVSTEITYFDRIGDSYILEGVLAFAGSVDTEAREGDDSGQNTVTPIAYRLPFALRLPIAGQPNFLEVNTRIGKWNVEPVSPGYLHLRADLAIQGLNGKNGYSFYCGEQEDWVQPEPDSLEKAPLEPVDALRTDAAGDVEENGEAGPENEYEQAQAGYDEAEWMIEAREEADEQDTLVYEPGSGWQEQLNSALRQPFGDNREEHQSSYAVEEMARAEDVEPQGSTRAQDELVEEAMVSAGIEAERETGEQVVVDEQETVLAARETLLAAQEVPHGVVEQEVREQEEDFQFEALAEEVANASQAVDEESAEKVLAAVLPEADEASAIAVTGPNDQALTASAAAEDPEALAESAIAGADLAAVQMDPLTATVDPGEPFAVGPKLSFGAKNEEEIAAPVKLSGLLYGSVTKNLSRDRAAGVQEADLAADDQALSDIQLQTAQATGEELAPDSAATGETEEDRTEDFAAAGGSSQSIWGNWIQKPSESKFTLKFRIIQEAESLDQIASKYDTPIENLMRANGLTNEQVDVGQILMIPGRRR